jgi:hypothetical protein
MLSKIAHVSGCNEINLHAPSRVTELSVKTGQTPPAATQGSKWGQLKSPLRHFTHSIVAALQFQPGATRTLQQYHEDPYRV